MQTLVRFTAQRAEEQRVGFDPALVAVAPIEAQDLVDDFAACSISVIGSIQHNGEVAVAPVRVAARTGYEEPDGVVEATSLARDRLGGKQHARYGAQGEVAVMVLELAELPRHMSLLDVLEDPRELLGLKLDQRPLAVDDERGVSKSQGATKELERPWFGGIIARLGKAAVELAKDVMPRRVGRQPKRRGETDSNFVAALRTEHVRADFEAHEVGSSSNVKPRALEEPREFVRRERVADVRTGEHQGVAPARGARSAGPGRQETHLERWFPAEAHARRDAVGQLVHATEVDVQVVLEPIEAKLPDACETALVRGRK